MGLYSSPPAAQTRLDSNPTLLMSWWATGFAFAIIVVRVLGRYIRTKRLFPDDWVMLLSILPLLIRMGLIHVVLLFGTNNAISDGFTEQDIRQRELGSKLVLAARIFYALFIWMAKFTVAEFLMRITTQIWRSSFRHVLQFIRCFIGITFVGVVIATLTECQPFQLHWQVFPDPGGKCRQGYAQLITMGVSDVTTDLLLVIFPIPILHLSVMPARRKISLMILFSLSTILVGITCYRVPSVISRHGSQQYRSLIASLEILAAAAVSNALVIGSYIRDKGVKRQKFKAEKIGSLTESVEPCNSRRATITHHHWGSDADLAHDLGIRLPPKLSLPVEYEVMRPAPVVTIPARRGSIDRNWKFSYPGSPIEDNDGASPTGSIRDSVLDSQDSPPNSPQTPIRRSATSPEFSSIVPSTIALNDVGGLLASRSPTLYTPEPNLPSAQPNPGPVSPQTELREASRSRNLLRAVTGFMSPPSTSSASSSSPGPLSPEPTRNFSRPISMTGGRVSAQGDSPFGPSNPIVRRPSRAIPHLQDAGGLLEEEPGDSSSTQPTSPS